MKTKRIMLYGIIGLTLLGTIGCTTDAQVVSENLSKEAGMFRVLRRIIFYNGITDSYILTVEGFCQVEHGDKLAVTCKTGPDEYKKHYLGLSDNVTYFSEQLDSNGVSDQRYKVIFKPKSIIPEVELSK